MVRLRIGEPLHTLAAILVEVARRSPGHLKASRCVEVKPLVTAGGEHACVARMIGTDGFERLVGVIAGATSSIRLEGFCQRPEARVAFAADFEALMRSLATGDDRLRVRMFEYRPPVSWRGMRRAHSTLWLPPGCPRDRSSIEVLDALPLGDGEAEWIAELVHGTPGGSEDAIEVGGLAGARFEEPGRTTVRLCDPRFRYELRFDHRGEHLHQLAFESLLRSIRSIPDRALSSDQVVPVLEWAL